MRLIVALSSIALVAAQSSIEIQVGKTADAPGGIFQFDPPSVSVAEGATVTFRFTGAPGNHSVTQSSFSDPCNPVSGGFDSGNVFIPPTGVDETPEWTLTITNASKPIWFFCKQILPLTHCAAGMVGAINAPDTGNTFEAFKAKAGTFKGLSGQGQGGLVGVGASASAPPGPIAGGATLFTGGAPAASATASDAAPNASSGAYTFPNTNVTVASPTAAGGASSPVPTGTGTGTGNSTSPSASAGQNSTGFAVPANPFAAFLVAALGVSFL